MADSVLSLSEPQLQKILAAISTQQPQWWPVVSVFVSALLAMIVGIFLDRFRARRDRIKAIREKQEHEIQQINAVVSGIRSTSSGFYTSRRKTFFRTIETPKLFILNSWPTSKMINTCDLSLSPCINTRRCL
jgi:hypothetical protein